ncbi:MAG: aminoacyl-tRNA deacylase [Desulforhopalus sp.]
MLSLSSAALQAFIDENRIQAVILPMDQETPTVPEAARVLGVAPEQILKSLVFLVKEEPLLVITNGVARVDRRKIAAHLEVGRSRIKFASVDRALDITGFVVGSMPPFGHLQKMRTLVDSAVTTLGVTFCGGGNVDAMMRITDDELVRVTSAEILNLSEDEG